MTFHNSKPSFIGLLAGALVLALMAGCSGDSVSAESAATTLTTSASSSSAQPAPVTVTQVVTTTETPRSTIMFYDPPSSSSDQEAYSNTSSVSPTWAARQGEVSTFAEPNAASQFIGFWLVAGSDGVKCAGSSVVVTPNNPAISITEGSVQYFTNPDVTGYPNQGMLVIVNPGPWAHGVIVGDKYASLNGFNTDKQKLTTWFKRKSFPGWEQPLVLCTS